MNACAATTLDGVLNRCVLLEQPATGYRVAIDTVLLAASVPALPGDRILDLGCGVGGAMICLAYRVPAIGGLGVDIQPFLVELCHHNIGRNVCAKGLDVRRDDVTSLPADLRGHFDHVLMNPPYHARDRHDVSPDDSKRQAFTDEGALESWIMSAGQALKPSGTVTIVHRADRRGEVEGCLGKAFGEIEVLPLLPREGQAPKRLILRARKDALFSIKESNGLVLHKKSGAYTPEAEAVLRHAQPMVFQSP
ncbi:MAG: methyltransferase [Alphaproteobacteria bacterium]|nr:methyltransferase [Alphaproteobacteria bacterium]